MTTSLHLKIIGIIGAMMLTIVALFVQFQNANASISQDQGARSNNLLAYDFFASSTPPGATSLPTNWATTTSATSTNINSWIDSNGRVDKGYIVVAGAKKITLTFSRTGVNGNAGSGNFFVETSNDVDATSTPTWITYSKLISNVTNTNGQTLTRVGAVSVSGTSTIMVTISPEDELYAIRCAVAETTDGEHRCRMVASF